jgi:hypothetical protein
VEQECAGAFNLTLGNLSLFFPPRYKHADIFPEQTKRLLTALPETLQEKCFLRCYGEETDTVGTKNSLNNADNFSNQSYHYTIIDLSVVWKRYPERGKNLCPIFRCVFWGLG